MNTIHEKVEVGVMLQGPGGFWGEQSDNGGPGSFTIREYGPIEMAKLHNPEFCKTPEDLAYPGAYFLRDLKKGKLVKVRKVTRWEVEG